MTRRVNDQKGNVQQHFGSWTLRFRELDRATGEWKTRRVVLGKLKDRDAALEAAAPIMAQVNRRNQAEPQQLDAEITFKEFIATHWEAYRRTAKHQPTTIENHNSLTKNHLMPFFKKRRLREVQPSDISRFLQSRIDEGLAGNTLQNLYGLLRLMFDIAAQFDIIDKSPVRPKLHKPEFERVEKPTLNAAQIKAIIARLPDETERVFALLLAVTGMRIGEALALRWTDFDPLKCELSIHHTLHRLKLKKPKTAISFGTLKLDPRIADLLTAHQARSRFKAEKDFIFCRSDGRPLNQSALRNHLYAVMDELEIARAKGMHGYHIFRHSAGTILHKRSRDLKVVQSLLRHSDISTTADIYVHLDDEVVSEGVGILADEILGIRDRTVTGESKMVS
ncbi:MAG: tyrosine-type recombinase/integrase [Blastocatellia bacterium]